MAIPVAASGLWPDDPDERAEIERMWHPRYGDRRQELVFIGVDLPADDLRTALDHCLLTPQEAATGEHAWREMPDPFPLWDLEEQDLVGHHHPTGVATAG